MTLRFVRQSPAFFGGVLLTLALGGGANAAVFSIVEAVLLRPLPYWDQDRVVMLWRGRAENGTFARQWTSGDAVQRWRAQAAEIIDVAGIASGSRDIWLDLVSPEGAERLHAGPVTPNFFEVLGVRAHAGRLFGSADEANPHVAVLAYDLWRRAFGGDKAIIGRPVTFMAGSGQARGPRSLTVIGVLPPDFKFSYPNNLDIVTLRSWSQSRDASIEFQAVGRLRDGVSFEAASARMAELNVPLTPGSRRETMRLERIGDG